MFFDYDINFSLASLFIVLVLLITISLYYSSTNLVSKRYRWFLIALAAMILLDIATVATNANGEHIPAIICQMLNGLYFFSGAVVAILFLYYCVSIALVDLAPSMKKKLKLINLIVLGLYAISLFVNNWTGFYFYVSDTFEYSHGPVYLLVNLVAILYVLESIVVLIIKRKKFSNKQLVSTILFYTCFFTSFILQLFAFPSVLLSDFGTSLGALIIFFTLETPDYVKLMRTLNELNELKASLEIQVMNRTEELNIEKKSYETLTYETLSSLAYVIDAKDHYTHGHSHRVAAYSKAIAERLGLPPQEVEQIFFAGLIHDVGKIGINEAILTKPGKLNPVEYETIKAHSSLGGDILKGIRQFPIFEEVARSHHERYDGTGYPDKLKGEDIPYAARIVAVADAYDAMTSDRSYRKALNDAIAIKELEDNKGTQFDPDMVDAFLALCKLFPDSIRNHTDELSQGINKDGPSDTVINI